ncbi:hypothetical protein CRG98_031896 [Punica granatum]|uniref:Complex 1 LYR protein domain-containing protein n=1 Tax=Punica granatum TaxID=22663 RepID=A0A2I0IVI9_PUNGR|nr:hypothetical protein CRG98_031896 [Punica granatum]
MASAAAKAPSRSEVFSLFRSLLRTARDFSDYNMREYMKRRTIDAFRSNGGLSDPQSVAKRQAIVYSLYAPKVKSVMELKRLKS